MQLPHSNTHHNFTYLLDLEDDVLTLCFGPELTKDGDEGVVRPANE